MRQRQEHSNNSVHRSEAGENNLLRQIFMIKSELIVPEQTSECMYVGGANFTGLLREINRIWLVKVLCTH